MCNTSLKVEVEGVLEAHNTDGVENHTTPFAFAKIRAGGGVPDPARVPASQARLRAWKLTGAFLRAIGWDRAQADLPRGGRGPESDPHAARHILRAAFADIRMYKALAILGSWARAVGLAVLRAAFRATCSSPSRL